MITLAFEGTAKVASVAVMRDDKLIASSLIDNGFTQSELLLPMAESLLSSVRLTMDDISLLATTTGPGSFTGVRIGAAVVKGLAFSRGIPCVGVSTLSALAENLLGMDGIIVPVMDARRGQFYSALFSGEENKVTRLTEDAALSAAELAELLSPYSKRKIYLVGDGYELAQKSLFALGVMTENTPLGLISADAASVARVALRMYNVGEWVADAELKPTYLRLPQAERERLERLNSKNNKIDN